MRKEFLGFALAMAAATTAPAATSESGRVRDVVSPDAIRLTLRGRIETVQLIGLDASDYDRPGREIEQLREKAIEYAASLALGQTVKLEKDSRLPDRNGDGRLQRYVFLEGGALLNAEMVTGGWARVAEKPFFGRADEFQKFQAEARTSGRGIWKGAAPASGAVASASKPLKGATPLTRPSAAMPPIATPTAKPSPLKATPTAVARVEPPKATPVATVAARPAATATATATPAAARATPTAVAKAATPRPTVAAAGTPAAKPQPTPAEATAGAGPDRDDVMAFLERWQTAWKARELEGYLALYAPGFTGDGLNFAGWRARKARVFPRAGDIKLSLTDVKIGGRADRAEVTFTQDYQSATLSDLGTKRMVLVRQSDGWRILSENWSRR